MNVVTQMSIQGIELHAETAGLVVAPNEANEGFGLVTVLTKSVRGTPPLTPAANGWAKAATAPVSRSNSGFMVLGLR